MAESYDYLLLGGGTSCGYAAAAIRSIDKDGSIGIISADSEPPYDRPPFSKNFLTNGDMQISDAHAKEEDFYEKNDIDLMLETEVYSLKPSAQAVETRGGELIHYGKLLYALGSEPVRPPIDGADRINLLRTASNSKHIRSEAVSGKSAVVIGGGWIGVEVAASLRARGVNVELVELSDRVLPKLGSSECAKMVKMQLESLGAKLNLGQAVAAVEADGSVRTKSGDSIPADFVVAGVGARPRLKMGIDAGLAKGEQGLLADATLLSSDPNIWIAGDDVEYPDPIMGHLFRAEHHLHAQWSGDHCGKCMAGEVSPYRKVPYFFSDIGDLSLIFRGDPDAKGRAFVLGSADGPSCTEIVLRDDGRMASFTDVRKDYSAQEPLTGMAEALIDKGISLESQVSAMSDRAFDPAELKSLL